MIDKFRIIRISFMISIVAVAVFVFAVTIRYNLLDMVHEKGLSSTSYWVLERVRKRLLAPERAPKGAYFSAVKGNYWLKESSDARESLPLYKTIKAIDPSQYPKSMPPDNLNFKTWTRSHGDNFNSKYASISQINKKNVRGLQRVWVYNSGEGDWKSDKGIKANNVETNPIFVNGKIFTTTPDAHIVAIDAKSGGELWRFKFAKGVPARRGMVWWKGDINHKPRIYLPIGGRLYAIDPDTGKPIEGFGDQGFVKISKSFVAPVIDQDRVIVATFAPSLVAFNVFTGKKIWETGLLESGEMPKKAGPFVISGGAPWSGIALDKERHIIFASTGNARQALYGALRPGDNKNSNSLVAIDGLTGSVLWAFQEVAHDLWDYDIPSPPTLTSIKKEDQLVDVVLVRESLNKFSRTPVNMR